MTKEIQMSKEMPEGGKELIGYNIEQLTEGKYSTFLAKGIIIDYYKVKSKGAGANTILGGKYLIDFGNGKKYWRRKNQFKVIENETIQQNTN